MQIENLVKIIYPSCENTDEIIKNENIKEFFSITNELINNPIVMQMQNYRQHYNTSCYEHCIEVAYWSYLFCKKHNLDYVSVARASILHDLFLYDWRNSRRELGLEVKCFEILL